MSPGERLRQRLQNVEPFGEDGQLRGKVPGTDQTVIFTLDGEVWADVSAELEALLAELGLRHHNEADAPPERTMLTWPADLAETSELAWDALCGRCSDADARRFLCRFGSAVAWLQEREDGRLATVPLDRRRMVRLLARCGRRCGSARAGPARSRRRGRWRTTMTN